jgi:hypothetical protein
MNKKIKTLIAIQKMSSRDGKIPAIWNYENFFWKNVYLAVALNDDFLIFKDLLADTPDERYQYHLYSIRDSQIIEGFTSGVDMVNVFQTIKNYLED